MAVTVNMFSANNLPINVNVNNAPVTFQIAAAGPNWMPATPATNPTFNPGVPTPGRLGVGTNNVILTPQESPSYFVAQMILPPSVNWSSIQIYVFFLTSDSCSWRVLNAGQQVSEATTFSYAFLRAL